MFLSTSCPSVSYLCCELACNMFADILDLFPAPPSAEHTRRNQLPSDPLPWLPIVHHDRLPRREVEVEVTPPVPAPSASTDMLSSLAIALSQERAALTTAAGACSRARRRPHPPVTLSSPSSVPVPQTPGSGTDAHRRRRPRPSPPLPPVSITPYDAVDSSGNVLGRQEVVAWYDPPSASAPARGPRRASARPPPRTSTRAPARATALAPILPPSPLCHKVLPNVPAPPPPSKQPARILAVRTLSLSEIGSRWFPAFRRSRLG